MCVKQEKGRKELYGGRVGYDGPLPSTQGDRTGGCRVGLTTYIILYKTTIGDLVDPLDIVKRTGGRTKKNKPTIGFIIKYMYNTRIVYNMPAQMIFSYSVFAQHENG